MLFYTNIIIFATQSEHNREHTVGSHQSKNVNTHSLPQMWMFMCYTQRISHKMQRTTNIQSAEIVRWKKKKKRDTYGKWNCKQTLVCGAQQKHCPEENELKIERCDPTLATIRCASCARFYERFFFFQWYTLSWVCEFISFCPFERKKNRISFHKQHFYQIDGDDNRQVR